MWREIRDDVRITVDDSGCVSRKRCQRGAKYDISLVFRIPDPVSVVLPVRRLLTER